MVDLSTPNEWQHICPETGLVLPWYTKSFLDDLVTWDLKNKVVLEIGGGASTVWWKKKSKVVWTLESNDEYIHDLHAAGCNILKYEVNYDQWHSMFKGPYYDIVIIDGVERDACVIPALIALKPGGILIIDNWMQPSVWIATEENQKLLTAMEHKVYRQDGHPDWQTAVFYKA